MARALIVRVDNTTEVKEFTVGDSYNMLREAVGGYIECVHLRSLGVDMWCNEEGKLIGLPLNELATELFFQEFNAVDLMVGDVIFTTCDDEGETQGLSQEQIDTLLAKVLNGTCPRCGTRPAMAYPALSRTDNKTRLCSACGLMEGIEQMLDCLMPQSAWNTAEAVV